MFSFRCLPSLASPADSATHSRFAKFLLPSSIYSASKATKDLKKLSFPHAYKVEVESPEKIETLKSMENWVEEKILPILKPVEKSWQPQDFLPDPASDEFPLQVNELRERTKEFPDELFVILAGNMLTEDTLPIFHSFVGSLEPFHDQENETGKGSSRTTAWEIWNNKWSAEENRHGDLLQKYLYLSGRVDMRQLEKTTQYLIGSGTDVGVGGSFYHGTIYTSFQERATFMSYGNIGNLAKQHGDTKLAQICGTIAADEKRHETAYKRIVAKVFEIDPNGMMKAFADMMKNKIKMPGHLMYDGHDVNLFLHFSNVTSRLGVYTIHDYINVLEHLVDIWNVEKLSGLSSEGQAAQDYVCGLPRKLRRMSVVGKTGQAAPTVPFSWIYQREV